MYSSTSSVSSSHTELLLLQRPHEACSAYRDAISKLGLNAKLHLCRDVSMAESYVMEHEINSVILDPDAAGEEAYDFIYNAATYRPEMRFGIVAGDETIISRLPGVMIVGVHDPKQEVERAQDFLPLFSLQETNPSAGLQGDLSTVSLLDLLQMQCHIQQDIALEIDASSETGLIEIEKGSIRYAQFSDERGLQALVKMLGLKSGKFLTQPLQTSHEPNLEGTWESILMNAALELDEQQSAS